MKTQTKGTAAVIAACVTAFAGFIVTGFAIPSLSTDSAEHEKTEYKASVDTVSAAILPESSDETETLGIAVTEMVETTLAATTAVETTTVETTVETTTEAAVTTETSVAVNTNTEETEETLGIQPTDPPAQNQPYMKGGRQALKLSPEGLTAEDLAYEYSWDAYYYYFPSSGYQITVDDYHILCNCVALEYGANWVPEWEMALVAEVIMNRYNTGRYGSIRDVIVAPYQFEHSDWYSGLDGFSNRVNDRVINAVNTYLAFPQYFNEGYTGFRGDGTWNYFT